MYLYMYVFICIVDTFFMKTCNYRGAQPRLFGDDANRTVEGILCEAQPMARYGIEPCYERHCFLCKHERAHRRVAADSGGIRFISKQIHHFVNKYEAILNCPAVSIDELLFVCIEIKLSHICVYRNVPLRMLSMH